MDTNLLGAIGAGVAACVMAAQGVYLVWSERRDPQRLRLQRTLMSSPTDDTFKRGNRLVKPEQESIRPTWDQWLRRQWEVDRWSLWVQQASLGFGLNRLTSWVFAAFVLGALLGIGLRVAGFMCLFFGTFVAGCLLAWVFIRRQRRLNNLRRQLPQAIDQIARALRAGHSLPAALHMVSEEASEPLASEFRVVDEEIRVGMSLEEVMRRLAKRVPFNEMRFFALAVLMQRETGGPVAEILSTIARLIRERLNFLAKVKVLAAEGQLSAWILGAMPWIVGGLIYAINPGFIAVLWTDPSGVVLLKGAAMLYVLGVLWMSALTRIRA